MPDSVSKPRATKQELDALAAEIRRVGHSLRHGPGCVDHLERRPRSGLTLCGVRVPQTALPVDLAPCRSCAFAFAAWRGCREAEAFVARGGTRKVEEVT